MTSAADNTVRVWSFSGECTGTIRADEWIHDLAVGRFEDADIIVGGGESGVLYIWDTQSLTKIREIPAHREWITALAIGQFNGQAVILSAGFDYKVKIWNELGRQIADLGSGHTSLIKSIAIGRLAGRDLVVSSSSDHTVRIWDPAGSSTTLDFVDEVNAVAISESNSRIIVGAGTSLNSWQVMS